MSSVEVVEIHCSQCGEFIAKAIFKGFTTAICLVCEQGDGFKRIEDIPLPDEVTGRISTASINRTFGTTREDLMKKPKKNRDEGKPFEVKRTEVTQQIESSRWKKK